MKFAKHIKILQTREAFMKISAGIVLFEPDILRLKQNVEAIKTDVEHIFLVDNGSKNINEVKSIFENDSKISFILNEENLGIAKALNQLCEIALAIYLHLIKIRFVKKI